MGNTGGVTVGCTVFDFLSGRTARLNDGKGTEPIRPVVAGWQARDCVPVYGHHDSGLCQLGATGVANRVEVSLSSFRQPLVSGCIKTDRSRPAGIPYLNRQCLLPDTAIALLENQPGRPCPNPDAPPRRGRALYGADALGDIAARCCGRRNSSA